MKKYLGKNSDFLIYAVLAIVALFVGAYAQWPTLSSRYVISDDDVMQHTYWMNRFHDPELFKDDLYVQYSDFTLPVGFKAVYFLGTFLTDPITLGKILSLILFAFSGVSLFRLGSRMQGFYTGITLSFLFICFPSQITSFFGGLQRSFAYPLLIVFLECVFRLNIRACIFLLILQIFFYPALFFISFLTLAFVFLGERKALSKTTFLELLIPMGVWCVFLFYKNFTKPAFLGDLTEIKVIMANLDHIVYGRSPGLPVQSVLLMMQELMMSHKFFFITSLLFSFSFFIDFLRKKQKALLKYKVVLALFIASVVMYQVSNAVLLKLYLPVKYVRYSFPLIGLMVIAIGIGSCLERISHPLTRRIAFSVIGLTISLMYGQSVFLYDPKMPGVDHVKGVIYNVDQRAYKDLYDYIATLPKDVVISANPELSDYISTFSERKTFLKYEMFYPWFDKYAKTVERRIRDFYRAYYSSSQEEIHDFCVKNNVDYVVVSTDDFSREFLASRDFGLKDINDQVSQMIKIKKKFAVEDIEEKDIIYRTRDQKIFIVRGRIKKEGFNG